MHPDDAYEIRSVIESAMVTKAEMDIMTGKPESNFLEADILFHLTLLRASGNSLAEKIIVNAYRRNQFFGTHSHQRTLEHVASAWKFHCEILKACQNRDPKLAVRWLRDHIARSRRDALLPISRICEREG